MKIIEEAVQTLEHEQDGKFRVVRTRTLPGRAAGVPALQPVASSSVPLKSPEELSRLRMFHLAMRDRTVHDAFANLRTLIIQQTGRQSCSIVVTSVCPQGGASFVAANLAASFASDSAGLVLLLDCNLAGQAYSHLTGEGAEAGITDFLDGNGMRLEDIVHEVGIDRLRVVPAGTHRLSGHEYFTRPRARMMFSELTARDDDRAVIVDAPPVLSSANANVLADYCDAVVLVVPYAKVTRADVEAAVASLRQDKFLGIVFNDRPRLRAAG